MKAIAVGIAVLGGPAKKLVSMVSLDNWTLLLFLTHGKSHLSGNRMSAFAQIVPQPIDLIKFPHAQFSFSTMPFFVHLSLTHYLFHSVCLTKCVSLHLASSLNNMNQIRFFNSFSYCLERCDNHKDWWGKYFEVCKHGKFTFRPQY